jgi:RNA polymerase sigma factor (sigma-70 family)
MTGTAAKRALERALVPSDEELIRACLDGDAQAWSALIDRYKNLIYSIPIRLGMHQDAGDIFQVVCIDLLSKLSQLREPRALPKWLMKTCYHECLHHHRASNRFVELESPDLERLLAIESPPERMLVQLEQEQILREALSEIPVRCERVIRMLFYEVPARPYEEIAREIRVATGSIGFIRGRCLARLRKYLERKGF